jgi:acyl-ACP thioesterase
VDWLVERPTRGRVFEITVPVRFGDAEPGGRLRLDALARILQDAGNDDFLDAGLDPTSPWVARRSRAVVSRWPQLGESLRLATWCGGTGSRWAERRTSLVTGSGASIEVATLWVHVDVHGRPARLPGWFVDTYGESAGGRQVTSRLRLGSPTTGASRRPWPLRVTDLDVLGHVNNAAVWAPIEDECARRGVEPSIVDLEFAAALMGDDDVTLVSSGGDERLDVWLTVGDSVRVAASVAASVSSQPA